MNNLNEIVSGATAEAIQKSEKQRRKSKRIEWLLNNIIAILALIIAIIALIKQ